MAEQLRAALRARQAADTLGMGHSTFWRRAKLDPEFPKPVKLGPRTTVWLREDLDRWLSKQVEASK